MSISYTYISKKIIENKNQFTRILSKVEKDEESAFLSEKLKEKRIELFDYLANDILEEEGLEEIIKSWTAETGEIGWQEGVPLQHLLSSINVVKSAVWYIFEEERDNDLFPSSTVLHVIKKISPLFDSITSKLSQIYIEHHQKDWEKAQAVLVELSVPVVPITEGVAVLPLIGEIDSERSQLVMETSLRKSTELDLTHLLIDVSGVPVIDTVTAHHIYQIVHALKLVGVKATLTGIRPEIARSVVRMGVKFTQVSTKATLQQALNEIGLLKEWSPET
ncbi:STAS domain-containing protein [Halobacillus sp. BBL2006]|uniref:STAS domain-containing protein n=1 Tax=Halobacillus sp. BBL2006 TaxID=1543706 RepID=UPI0005436999|nr:STAS domain-containing protein [Halobacillus sp. BBL2006]KHE68331.1 hypothetical protein LD39_14815 [Halobacillus sp. BBL2006]